MPPKLLLVLGMHRSGTSVVTRSLQTLNVQLGTKLMPESGDNPRGYFEHPDIVSLNDDIFRRFNRAWENPNPIPDAALLSPDLYPLQTRAINVLDELFGTAPNATFTIKDPRMCMLLPFWNAVFDRLALTLGYILVTRHPHDIAASLKKRNNFTHDRALALIDAYDKACAQGLDGRWKNCIVRYDAMLGDPINELSYIATVFELQRNLEAMRDFSDNFIDLTLRHSRTLDA